MKKTSFVWLLISIAIAQGLGFLSSLLSGDIAAKYAAMRLPPLSPPGNVFGIAWIVLYFLMAIAAYLVFRSDAPQPQRRTALILYCVQLAVNFAWSPIFFSGALWVGSVLILVLDALAILTALQFFRIQRAAGWLMAPYILWLLFATYLSFGCAILN